MNATKTHSPLTTLKIFWSVFWRANIQIFVYTLFLTMIIAVLAAVIFDCSLLKETFPSISALIPTYIEGARTFAANVAANEKKAYVITIVVLTLLVFPFYLHAFKKLPKIPYKHFCVNFPPPNTLKQRFQCFIPFYFWWNLLWLICDFSFHFYLKAYLGEFGDVLTFILYVVITAITAHHWLGQSIQKNLILLSSPTEK